MKKKPSGRRETSAPHTLGYEKNSFWGTASFAFAIIVGAIGARIASPVFFVVAWALASVSVWIFVSTLARRLTSVLIAVGASVAIAISLYALSIWLSTPAELDRPYLVPTKTEWSGPGLDGQFELVVTFQNIGHYTASNLTIQHFAIAATLKGAFSAADALRPAGEVAPGAVKSWYSTPVPITAHEPAAFHVFAVAYDDRHKTGHKFDETWFLKWDGSGTAMFDQAVHEVTREEKVKILKFLSAHGYRLSEF